MRRRLPACLLLAFALAGPTTGLASAADKPVRRPPTRLWNAFPLREKPVADTGVAAATATRVRRPSLTPTIPIVGAEAGAASSDPATKRITWLLMLLEISLMLCAISFGLVLFWSDIGPPALLSARTRRTRGPPVEPAPARSDAATVDRAALPKIRRRRARPARRQPAAKIARAEASDAAVLKAKQSSAVREAEPAADDVAILKAKLAVPAAPPKPAETPPPADPPAGLPAAREESPPEPVLELPLMPRLSPRRPNAPSTARVPVAAERCSVFWRPGYVSGEFVAKTDAKATTTLASSPGLRGPHPPRETAKSTAALEALVEQLAREGWVPSGRRGRDWFELEFARSLEAAETCRIEWSHAYVTARFEAVISKASGEREFIADSPDFRCLRDRPPEPDDEHARKALDELVAELKTFGWWTSGQGDEWFALEFRRHRVPSGAGPAWR